MAMDYQKLKTNNNYMATLSSGIVGAIPLLASLYSGSWPLACADSLLNLPLLNTRRPLEYESEGRDKELRDTQLIMKYKGA